MSGTALPDNLRLIGGEMLVWSDDDVASRRQPVHGRALGSLAESACSPGSRVLVAGPHALDLVARLADRRVRVTCLLRSYEDSAAAARHFPDGRVQVLCGSLAKLTVEDPFDTIIAFDGLGRLASVEGANLSWGEAYDLLLAALRPGGRLLLAVDNALGLHRLVEMTQWYADRGDAAWTPVGEFDESRPRSLAQLTERVTKSGLRVGYSYAAYPVTGAPSVLVRTDAAATEVALQGYLDGAVAAACGQGFADTVVLTDPRRLAISAMRAGLAVELAPTWIVVADRQTGSATMPELPAILVADAWEHAGWGVEYEVVRDSEGAWVRRLIGDAPGRTVRGVERDPALLAGPMPTGRSLEELLIGACLRRDLPELRRILSEYATWLAGLCDVEGQLPGEYAFAIPRLVLSADGRFTLLDPSWRTTGPLPYDVALTRALRHFAVALITGAYAHPWPATIDADGLTVILAGMAGQTIERNAMQAAVEAEVDILAAIRGLDAAGRGDLLTQLAAVDAGTPPLDMDSHRELREAMIRLRGQLEHAEAQLKWYQELLSSREYALKRAQRTINVLSGSISFRAGRALIAPARLLKRLLRRAIRRTPTAKGNA
jgi:hypothetical protein